MVLHILRKIKKALGKKATPVPTDSTPKPAAPRHPSKAKAKAPVAKPDYKGPRKHQAKPADGKPKAQGERRRKRKHSDGAPSDKSSHQARQVSPKTDWNPADYQVPEVDNKTRFLDLDLPDELRHALSDLNFQYCTPIQEKSLPRALDGTDICGRAQTGTGKTAAFLLTIFSSLLRNPPKQERRHGRPRALILAPTRELCLQIAHDAEEIGKYTNLRILPIYGGMDLQHQRKELQTRSVDVIVATPGRLLDFRQRQDVDFGAVEILVIDEADRMLDMGFIPDVRRIVYGCPPKDKRQTLLFSATLTPDVTRLASQWMQDALTVDIEPEHVAADTIDQRVYIVTGDQKFTIVYNILQDLKPARVIIFANRRDSSDLLCQNLQNQGMQTALLSGAVEQKKRLQVLENFRTGNVPVLVATDVAGRGLHIDGIDLIINFNVPEQAEDYVHRIGRTGRVGQKGISVTFADELDSYYLPAIEEYMKQPLKYEQPPENWLTPLPKPILEKRARRSSSGSGGRGPSRSGGRPRRSGPPRRRK